jgi:hypothetical protein
LCFQRILLLRAQRRVHRLGRIELQFDTVVHSPHLGPAVRYVHWRISRRGGTALPRWLRRLSRRGGDGGSGTAAPASTSGGLSSSALFRGLFDASVLELVADSGEVDSYVFCSKSQGAARGGGESEWARRRTGQADSSWAGDAR